MDILEMKLKKDALEDRISDLITEFSDDIGMNCELTSRIFNDEDIESENKRYYSVIVKLTNSLDI